MGGLSGGRGWERGCALHCASSDDGLVSRADQPRTRMACMLTRHHAGTMPCAFTCNYTRAGYTGYVNDVDNKYMHDYFPLAAATAKAMKANASDGGDRFVYTTHAWLMQRFLSCPCPQPHPTPPCATGLPGVWTSANGGSRFYFSSVRKGTEVSVRCLTTDWEATPAGACAWSSGTCSLAGTRILCALDNGKTIAGTVSAGAATIAFAGAAWRKFTGPLSGLWYGCKRVVNGPNDPQQYLVIGHNASTGAVSVWWDTGLPPDSSAPARQWTYSTHGVLGPVKHSNENIDPFFQNRAKTGFEMCFAIGSEKCRGSQPKHVSNPECI